MIGRHSFVHINSERGTGSWGAYIEYENKLIPKPILFSNHSNFRTIFMIRNSIDYSKFDLQKSNFEFWDSSYNRALFSVEIWYA